MDAIKNMFTYDPNLKINQQAWFWPAVILVGVMVYKKWMKKK
jgi:hypothetical protein